MKSKDDLTVVEAELSVREIATALRLTEAQVVEKFKDPRVTSWFAEIWGERLFGYKTHESSNYPGSDARIDIGALGRFDISVRCFNRHSIKFQKSKFIGSGRHATADDLIESIESVERFVIVDLRNFPLMRFVPIDSKKLLRLVRLKRLTYGGITPRHFDSWLEANFLVTVMKVDLGAEAVA